MSTRTAFIAVAAIASAFVAPAASVGGSTAAGLPVCSDDSAWRCGGVEVPVDRADPAAGTIRIAFYVSPHTGSGPGLEPIFIAPGGPGESGWSERFFYERASALSEHHDLVLIDPRGTGRSGPINCAD